MIYNLNIITLFYCSMNSNDRLCICKHKEEYFNDYYHCVNIQCKLNNGDKCPICKQYNASIGDDPLLYDCDKCSYIWSYHHECPEISNPSITPSKFIGHLLADDEFTGDLDDIEELESNDNFVKSKPYNIEYEDCSTFVWKCLKCNEKYANMYCG